MEVISNFSNTRSLSANGKLMYNIARDSSKGQLHRRTSRSRVATTSDMEIEIKLRLPSEEAHDRLQRLLESSLIATHQQENVFFDGGNREFSKTKTIVRCRFYNGDEKALLTIKGQQVLKDGIGRGTEVEEEIAPQLALAFPTQPDKLLELDSKLLQPILRSNSVTSMICLGGFKNERKDFLWEGFKLELDKTMFAHGTVFEVEVETEQPELLKGKLEAFLHQNGVPFQYSKTTKFSNFLHKTLE